MARIGQAGWSRARIADGRLVVMPRTAHDLPASAIHDHVADFLDEDPGPTE